ncbi:hypothetical protein TNCV_4339971 [Trichonephila clavipes]|nr:hypothetical protein TNCV_4339971 [Trichonephila clavipes]
MKRLKRVRPSMHYKVMAFVHGNARPPTANIFEQFLGKKELCKLNIRHFATSQFSRLLPIPTTQTRFKRKEIDDISDIQRKKNVTRFLNSISKENFFKVSRTCIADLSGA